MSIYTLLIQFLLLSLNAGGASEFQENDEPKAAILVSAHSELLKDESVLDSVVADGRGHKMFSVVQHPLAQVPKAAAKNAETAIDLVNKVQDFYQKTKFLEAKFRQVITNKTFGRDTISDGKVYLAKPGKMRWDYYKLKKKKKKPVYTKSFISDGKTLWAVLVEDKQFYKKDLSKDMLPVAVSFLTGEGDLNRDFTASIDTKTNYGTKSDIVLKLVPKKSSASYKTLWLVVDSVDYRVKSSIVLNTKDDTNKISFFAPKTNKPIAATLFKFNEKANKSYKLMKAP